MKSEIDAMDKADVVFFCVALIREQLKELGCVLPLKTVMKTSSPKSAVALLSVLSAYCTHETIYDYLHSRLIMVELVTVSDVSLMSSRLVISARRKKVNADSFIKIQLVTTFPWFDFWDILVSEGLLEEIGQLLHHHRSSSVIIKQSRKIIIDLWSSCMGQQVSKAAVHILMLCACL